MRILLLADLYPPTIGGTERHVQDIARQFVARGHEVAVATGAIPGAPALGIDEGVHVHRLEGWSRHLPHTRADSPFHPTAPDPAIVRALARLHDEFEPDIVHAHGWILHSWLPLARRRRSGFVVTLHDYGFICANKTLLDDQDRHCPGPSLGRCLPCAGATYGRAKAVALLGGLALSRRWHGSIDHLVANSAFVAQAHRGRLPADVPLTVVPSFVPEALPRPGNRPAFLPDGDVVVFAGALSRHKGFDVLAAAVASGRISVPVVALGPRRTDTPRDLPAGLTVVEDASHRDVLCAFAHSAVATVPSRWPEPLGLVALEALSVGTPVVASRVGGLPEIVRPNENGILVPPGDPAALAEAINALIADPLRRAQLGAAGRVRAEAASAVPLLLEIYGATVADHRAGSQASRSRPVSTASRSTSGA